MSTITPPLTPIPPLPQTTAQVTVTVSNPTPDLANLTKGTTIEAIVTAPTNKGQVQVETPVGKFAMRTTMPLPEGTKLALQVANVGKQVQLRITALNGTAINLVPSLQAKTPPMPGMPDLGKMLGNTKASTQINAQKGPQAAPKQASASAALRTTLATLKRTHGIQAQVVRGATPTTPGQTAPPVSPGGTPQLLTGTKLTVRINSAQPPQSAQATQQATAPQVAKPAGTIPTQAGRVTAPTPVQGQPAQAAQAPAPTQGAGQPIAGTIQAGTATPRGQIPLMTLQGVIAANTQGTQPIVNTPQGMIALSVKGEFPPGTQISLDVMTQTPPPAARAGSVPLPAPPLSGNTGWPNLDQALQALQQSNPKLAQQLQSVLPQANTRLAAAMIAFTSAMRTGDSRNWPGEGVMKGLEKANGKLAKSLGNDLSDLSSRTTESAKGEWKALSLPFANGAEIEKIMLYVHRDPQEEEEDENNGHKKEDTTRFLIDLDLSRLGPMQLDGYVVSKDRRFDLIIRTKEPLDQQVRRNILGMYNNSLDALGIKGTVSFLITRDFVRPQISPPEETPGHGLVV